SWYPTLRALDTRYAADAALILAICVALAFLPVADGRPVAARVPPGADRDRPPASVVVRRDRLLRPVVAAYVVLFVAGSAVSARAYEDATTGSPSAAYIANASAAIRGAAPGTRVVAGQVPPDIGYYARTSSVIGDMVPGKLDWVSKPTGTLDGLQMF